VSAPRWPWRRQPDPLGEGVWRRAHDRSRRAVDRFHQVVEPVPAGPVREGLDEVAADLVAALDRVRTLCVQAQAAAPSGGLEVPAGPDGGHPELHRAVSRWAGLAAQASWSATSAAVAEAAGDRVTAMAQVESARRAAAIAASHLPS
jgi:hypothetical protein